MLEITMPNPAKPSFTQRVALDGADYELAVEWNMRSGWYAKLTDPASEEVIFGAQRISADWNLLHGCTHDRRPPGILFVSDTSGTATDPGYEDLGQRCLFLYVEAEEVQELLDDDTI